MIVATSRAHGFGSFELLRQDRQTAPHSESALGIYRGGLHFYGGRTVRSRAWPMRYPKKEKFLSR